MAPEKLFYQQWAQTTRHPYGNAIVKASMPGLFKSPDELGRPGSDRADTRRWLEWLEQCSHAHPGATRNKNVQHFSMM
jgi:hypothetical protein